uniref:SET domain-containing protein n=1 Tax=Leptocylindrus danicus TaxID=163516 RepID=A0A7S2NSD2_9STRA|mmetsp:Transcript_11718/g.17687  ORF Transcript_11718/g.17687 Transcript_11718/m.17687 type:complete len:461 (+) Transcript_11718:236-1618(+)|eukprot:CAMPEP_0116012668 /NCGR_PEP_ID=MMETSP0321-20121206/5254_1 /TAXON_ID=163516 /ORGANISM="Leptocylindrus danicus var. danicus, Strain B650" /LENGTH=460 /DNA_ID=CAMNT_0003482043 /DNA_START=114 /DNA_END=1496 /DNA_ORIENTATION=+
MRISPTAFFVLLSSPMSVVFAFAPSSSSQFASIAKSSSTSTSLDAMLDTREQASRNMQPFDGWLSQCGVQRCNGFQFTSTDGLDWSIMTTENLPSGSPIIGVPEGMILSSNKAKQELEQMSRGGVQDAVKQLGMIGAAASIPEFYLTTKILLEYEREQQSPYFPWLDSLPRLFYNAVSMTDFCYECLPPLVFRLSREERTKFDNIFQVLKKVDILSDRNKTDRELVKWAFNVVHTRSMPGDKNDVKIVPLADYFNHGTETEINFTFDAQGNCLGSASRDVPAGSPVRMSYGCPTNPSFFFATYGFLDKTSPASFCKIMDITKSAETENLGYDFSKMLFYKDTGAISQEVWDVVLYDKVLRNKPDVRQQFYNAHLQGDGATKQAIHNAFIMETSSRLKDHVDKFLEQIDALNNKGIGKDLNTHPRLPLIMEHNEFVRSTFENVKAQLDPMVMNLARERQMA